MACGLALLRTNCDFELSSDILFTGLWTLEMSWWPVEGIKDKMAVAHRRKKALALPWGNRDEAFELLKTGKYEGLVVIPVKTTIHGLRCFDAYCK